MSAKEKIVVSFKTRVLIEDEKTGEVLLDKQNAVHPRNMARAVARGLANEPNHQIFRIAFGNGGTFTDSAGNTVFNPPNIGQDAGWESRLYNETYSEIVDETSAFFGTDPGSADSNVVRPGGGSVPSGDPAGGGVTSEEAGVNSNLIIRVRLNEDEPSGQLTTQSPMGTLTQPERTFLFDEIGLYSPGRPAASTSGYSGVAVGNKISEDVSPLSPSTVYTFTVAIDTVNYTTEITTPVSGTGPLGQITYGDLCEGINTGDWITGGDAINSVCYVYITDRSGGAYPSIIARESFGFLVFQSLSVGDSSSVLNNCDGGNPADLFNVLTSNICVNANANNLPGRSAGVVNDASDPSNERERLLTHLIFSPILKSADRILNITYTITVSVGCTQDSEVLQLGGSTLPE